LEIHLASLMGKGGDDVEFQNEIFAFPGKNFVTNSFATLSLSPAVDPLLSTRATGDFPQMLHVREGIGFCLRWTAGVENWGKLGKNIVLGI